MAPKAFFFQAVVVQTVGAISDPCDLSRWCVLNLTRVFVRIATLFLYTRSFAQYLWRLE